MSGLYIAEWQGDWKIWIRKNFAIRGCDLFFKITQHLLIIIIIISSSSSSSSSSNSTAFEFSLGGNSSYTSTDKTNRNKYR